MSQLVLQRRRFDVLLHLPWRGLADVDNGEALPVAGPDLGPAGLVLDEALQEAGIARDDAFVTNAVKHFKYEMRGKRRLHKKPNAYEIERCRWWLERERAIVRPAAIVTLGATAAHSVLGRATGIAKARGRAFPLADGTVAFVTIHPSYLLRIQDREDKEREYGSFVADLSLAKKTLAPLGSVGQAEGVS